MKLGKYYIAGIFLICSSVNAEPRPLPPVVDHSSYQGGKQTGSRHSSPQARYEILGRLEQLQAEMQQLRGIVEEQDFTIIELKKRIKNIYLDVDQRLQDIENSGENDIESGGGDGITPKTSNEFEQSDPAIPDNQKTSRQSFFAPRKQLVSQKQPNKNEKQDYQTAYDGLVNGHTSQAIKLFNTFLNDFPHGKYSANAQYWLGEAYSIKQDFNSARKAFNQVIAVYQGNPKVADAMLKLGYLEDKAKNPVKAREWLTTVTMKYPGTTAAHLAAKKIKQLK
jgi:tol-pal system protein YbgF